MRNGFTFNGRHTNYFEGVTVKTKDRPIFSSVKEQTYSAAEMDGEYDFSEVSGHEYFNPRTFVIEFHVSAENLRLLQKKLTALSKWFRGRGELIFDDIPLVKWNVRIFDSVSYMPEHGGHTAMLSVTYKAMPFSELVFDLLEGPVLDSDIELDSDFPLDGGEQYFTFSGAGTYKHVPNVGDAHVKPVITVTGAVNPFKISINGAELTVKRSGDFVIDGVKEQVYSGNTSLMQYVSGDFFELAPGIDNTMTVSANTTVQISYVPLFLYDGDFDGTLWGDEDAQTA